jgi:hypothetical protein
MSEKIYALLLRLYPSHFREAYGQEALQLFRDRVRDEKAFSPRLRLWLDLLADLIVSVPRQHFHVQRALVSAYAQSRLDGIPSFFVLESEPPRFEALLFGGLLSFVALAAIFVPSGQIGNYHPLATWGSQSQTPQLSPDGAASTMVPAANDDMNLNSAERQRVIEGAIANLNKYYVDPDVAQKTVDALLAHKKSGDDDGEMDGAAFAELLTRQMQKASQDAHLELVYSKVPLPQHSAEPTPEDRARYRKSMEQQNCMFETATILPHNIGYWKLNFFPETSVCQSTATAAMASLNHADAVIFDLRDNTGGFPNMVTLIAGYLFDHPEYLYNPREAPTPQSWTQSPVPGNRLADKPVYVLTSARTISGAEQFCYNLKMLKRATLVGETTHGSAHAGAWHRIDEHFGMGITEAKTINPYSKTDWEGTGVEPDVKVKAEDALETAKKLAERHLWKR